MEKEFITYELAVKLKELGFDEECLCYFLYSKNNIHSKKLQTVYSIRLTNIAVEPTSSGNCYAIKAPLWQQAFKFIQSKIDLYEQGLELTLTSKDWILTDGTYYKSKNEKALMRLITLVEDEK